MSTKQNLHKAFTILYALYERDTLPNIRSGICGNFALIINNYLKLHGNEIQEAYTYMHNELFLKYPYRAMDSTGYKYKGYIVDGPLEDTSKYWENPKRIKLLKWLIEQTKE